MYDAVTSPDLSVSFDINLLPHQADLCSDTPDSPDNTSPEPFGRNYNVSARLSLTHSPADHHQPVSIVFKMDLEFLSEENRILRYDSFLYP